MKKLICAAAWFVLVAFSRANMAVGPWIPIVKGIDRAVGTNYGSTAVTNNGVVFTDSTLQSVNCVRVDLSDPDVQLFTTPRATNYVAESRETVSMSVSNFLKTYGLQVASDCNFYTP